MERSEKEIESKQLLLFISDMTMNICEWIKYIKNSYSGYELTLAAFRKVDDINLQHVKQILNLNEEAARENLTSTINKFDELCFLSPGLKQMQALVVGDDSGYFESLVIYSLLHKKKTVFLLDYKVDNLPSNSFTRKIKSLLGSISEMGIFVDILGQAIEKETEIPLKHKKLITQKDVEDIYKSGTKEIFCEKGCIITPLAKDRAKEMGVNFVRM
ncbi:MAG: hypothetical protein ACYCYE_15940 [Clostridia bacterium]